MLFFYFFVTFYEFFLQLRRTKTDVRNRVTHKMSRVSGVSTITLQGSD
jgi:hypothetical protein